MLKLVTDLDTGFLGTLTAGLHNVMEASIQISEEAFRGQGVSSQSLSYSLSG